MNLQVKRKGPKNGYISEAKSDYRRKVWETITQNITFPLLENQKILMMPSLEGIEIEVALSFGIKPHQIIAIDKNKEIIDKCTWKLKYPEVHCFNCKVSEVYEILEQNQWVLAAANLDFCYNIGRPFAYEVQEFLTKAPVTKDFVFFVTVSKGREIHTLHHYKRRVEILYDLLTDLKPVEMICSDSYIASKVTMIFAGFKVVNKPLTKHNLIEKIMSSKFNKWTEEEDEVASHCIQEAYTITAGAKEAAKILDRTEIAIKNRWTAFLRPEGYKKKRVINAWTQEECDVVIACMETSINVKEGARKAATIINRTIKAIEMRWYSELSPKSKGRKRKIKKQIEPSNVENNDSLTPAKQSAPPNGEKALKLKILNAAFKLLPKEDQMTFIAEKINTLYLEDQPN